MASTIEQMTTHLQFLGYETSQVDDATGARHPRKLNLLMKPLAGGVLFTAILGGNRNAKNKRSQYLDLINSLNNKAAVARFYADDDSDLFVEAWHPDWYERTAFGTFMEVWDHDCSLLLGDSEAVKYLE